MHVRNPIPAQLYLVVLLFFFFSTLVQPCSGTLTQINFQIGSFNVFYLYNASNYLNTKVVMSRFDLTTRRVWFMAVESTSTTQNIACRRISQQRIIVGPNGCSNINNPALAIQSSNCLPNEIDVVQRRALFQQCWYLSKTDNRCFLRGCGGDIRLCMGPMRLALDNEDSFTPRDKDFPSEKQLLAARKVFVDGLVGPYAMSPTVVEVPLVLPAISISLISGGPLTDFTGQSYTPWNLDPYVDTANEVWEVFRGSIVTALRLMLTRAGGPEGVNYYITLGSSVAAGVGYTYIYQSEVQNTTVGGELVLQDWIELFPFNTPIPMYNYSSRAYVGTVNFTISSPSSKFLLQPVYPITRNNYTLNVNPRRYWVDAVCNYHNGFLDPEGDLTMPDCLPEDVCGGYVTYVYPEFPNLPIGVPEDPTLDYRFSCEEFYPQANTFLDYGQDGVEGRATVPRMGFVQELCYSPFVAPDLIRLNINPNEKFLQCQKLGASVVGASQSACGRPITQLTCKQGYYYFDQKCFYKFDPTTESRYASPIDDGGQKCASLNQYALLLVEVDEYLQQWLLNYFLYLRRDLNNFAQYRIPQYRSDKCTCYSTATFTVNPTCSCFGIEDPVTSDLIFPICYYPVSTPELEPRYSTVQVALQTARLWRYGQIGPKPNGFEGKCVCFNGWTGKNCERVTCPVTSSLDNLQLSQFFAKCRTGGQGDCFNDQPRVCKCNFGFAPHASVLPSLGSLYTFRDTPCLCPAAKGSDALFFQINTGIYPSTDINAQIPCSGVENGICLASNSSVSGTCSCITRLNIVLGEEEPSFDGNRCACERPIQPYAGDTKNGPIINALCNYKGVCCPSGQSVYNPLVGNLYDEACFNQGEEISGCSCFNGWGGESCTCPVPFNLASGLFKEEVVYGGEEFVFINLRRKYLVTQINVSDCSLPSLVQISNSPGVQSASSTCNYNFSSRYYDCFPVEGFQYVVLSGTASVECTIKAYERVFQFCGANHTVSNFAGRFYAISAYRSDSINLLTQPLTMASFGCTNTDCMCNEDYGGELCAARVSSIRETVVTVEGVQTPVQAKVYCGETVEVPSLIDPVQGRGEIDPLYLNCSCSEISAVDATGRIGAVRERFIGEACQCATGYNVNYREVMTCSGHGTCESTKMVEGACEEDLVRYEADALFNPFVVVTDTNDGFVDVEVLEDSFFYGQVFFDTTDTPTAQPTFSPTLPTKSPTKSPTRNPTKNPTRAPTRNPTRNPTLKPTTGTPSKSPTKNPTKKPTTSPTRNPTTKTPTKNPTVGRIYLIRSQPAYISGGALGDRATTTGRCQTLQASLGLTCGVMIGFLSYGAGDTISNMPTNYGFSASHEFWGMDFSNSANVVFLASSWTAAFSTGLATSLQSTVTLTSQPFWTGGLAATDNCLNWTSDAFANSAVLGSSTSTASTWSYDSTQPCSVGRPQLCICTP